MALRFDYNPIPQGGESHFDTLSRAFDRGDGKLQQAFLCCGVPYSADVVSDNVVPSREGSGQWSFKLFRHRDDPGAGGAGQANRVTTWRNPSEQSLPQGVENWYGVSIRPGANNETIPGGFHVLLTLHNTRTDISGVQIFSLQHRTGGRMIIFYGRENTGSTPHTAYDQSGVLTSGSWHDIVLHIKSDPVGTSGLMEVWHNGTKIVNLHNISLGFLNDQAYFQIHSYKSGTLSGAFTRTYYFSRIRHGDANSSYNEAAPRVIGAASVGDVVFTKPGRIYSSSIQTGMSCANSDRIIYTLDRSHPSGGGNQYSASLSLADTVWVRARGESDTLSAGPTTGEVFIRDDLPSAATPIRRNSGSAVAYAHFPLDADFSDGTTFQATDAVDGTEEDLLFQKKRFWSAAQIHKYGPFTVPNGRYRAFILMNLTQATVTGPDQRQQNVIARGGGAEVTASMDFWEAGGLHTAWVRTLENIDVLGGSIELDFVPVLGTSECCGFEIIAQGVVSSTPVVSEPILVAGSTPTHQTRVDQALEVQAPNVSALVLAGGQLAHTKVFQQNSAPAASPPLLFSGAKPVQIENGIIQSPTVGALVLSSQEVGQAVTVNEQEYDWNRKPDQTKSTWRRRIDSLNQ